MGRHVALPFRSRYLTDVPPVRQQLLPREQAERNRPCWRPQLRMVLIEDMKPTTKHSIQNVADLRIQLRRWEWQIDAVQKPSRTQKKIYACAVG